MLGELLALGAAMSWAVSVILFKRSETIQPFGLNLFKNLLTLLLLLPTLWLLGQGFDLERPAGDWLRLVISGVLGIAVADNLFFISLRLIGPGTLAIVHTAYAPIITLLAFLLLGERPGPGFLAGAVLVVSGILLVTSDRAPTLAEHADRRRLWLGVALGLIDVSSLGVGVIIVKPVLETSHLVEVTTLRVVAGIAAQFVWLMLIPARRAELGVLRPQRVWRTLVPASFLGTYVSMLLWLGGFKWASASVASVLNQTSLVFQIGLARVFLGETLSRRRALGGLCAMVGAVLVIVLG